MYINQAFEVYIYIHVYKYPHLVLIPYITVNFRVNEMMQMMMPVVETMMMMQLTGLVMITMILASRIPAAVNIICTAAPLLERERLALGPPGLMVPQVALVEYAR